MLVLIFAYVPTGNLNNICYCRVCLDVSVEVVGKGLKKGFGIAKGIGKGIKEGVKGEEKKEEKK